MKYLYIWPFISPSAHFTVLYSRLEASAISLSVLSKGSTKFTIGIYV
ncbi:hypothetical protein [Xanthocytophaga agilis]|nr:hypothetical protein [Xanthocytophaga agilis]